MRRNTMEVVDNADQRVSKAQGLLEQFNGTLEGFRSNKELTAEAKRRGLAQSWVTTAEAIRALKDEYLGEAARQKKALEEKLVRPPKLPFGATPSEAIARDASFRDALDRAEKAETPDALLAVLRRGELYGDPIQVRAAVAVAI